MQILNIKEVNELLENSKWEFIFYKVILTESINGYYLFAERKRSGLWFTVDVEPLLEDCYTFTSLNLIDCCEWLINEVGESNFLYY